MAGDFTSAHKPEWPGAVGVSFRKDADASEPRAVDECGVFRTEAIRCRRPELRVTQFRVSGNFTLNLARTGDRIGYNIRCIWRVPM